MAAKTHKMFIGGKWVDAADGKTFEDMNSLYVRSVRLRASSQTRGCKARH